MNKNELYKQYQYEVALFEQYGSKNIITFDEWLKIKNYDKGTVKREN